MWILFYLLLGGLLFVDYVMYNSKHNYIPSRKELMFIYGGCLLIGPPLTFLNWCWAGIKWCWRKYNRG